MSGAYRFTGRKDEFLQGVPQKDISVEEFAALTAEQKTILEANVAGPAPLYEAVRGSKASQPSKGGSESRRGATEQGRAS